MSIKKDPAEKRRAVNVSLPITLVERLLAIVSEEQGKGWGTVTLSSVVTKALEKGLEGKP